MLRRLFPHSRLSRCLGQDNRQLYEANMQLPGKYILPSVYGTLPFYLPVLCMGKERKSYLQRIVARCGSSCNREHRFSLCLLKMVRYACSKILNRQIPEEKNQRKKLTQYCFFDALLASSRPKIGY